jgi:hypothetical protein
MSRGSGSMPGGAEAKPLRGIWTPVLGCPGVRIQAGPVSSSWFTSVVSGRPRPTLSKPISGIVCANTGAAIAVAASAHNFMEPLRIASSPLNARIRV